MKIKYFLPIIVLNFQLVAMDVLIHPYASVLAFHCINTIYATHNLHNHNSNTRYVISILDKYTPASAVNDLGFIAKSNKKLMCLQLNESTDEEYLVLSPALHKLINLSVCQLNGTIVYNFKPFVVYQVLLGLAYNKIIKLKDSCLTEQDKFKEAHKFTLRYMFVHELEQLESNINEMPWAITNPNKILTWIKKEYVQRKMLQS